MHEMSLAAEMLRVCTDHLKGRPARIERVVVAVGELSAVEPDLLRYAWEALTVDSPHEGAKLDVEWHAARQVCDTCGEIPERSPGLWLRLCPRCERAMRVEGGDQLDVMRLSFVPLDPAESDAP